MAKKKSKKKLKKQQAMKAAFADNKISKKEAKKLSKMGISQAKLQKNYNKQFKPGNFFSLDQLKPGMKPGTLFKEKKIEAPTYTPLQMSGGAQKALPATNTGVQYNKQFGELASQIQTLQAQLAQQQQQPTAVQEFDTSFYDDIIANQDSSINDLNKTIADLTKNFQDQSQSFKDALDKEKADAEKALEDMQGNFAQAMANQKPKGTVEGIKFATAGTGGATQAQLAKMGIAGSFGRGGQRLMKISSLNV